MNGMTAPTLSYIWALLGLVVILADIKLTQTIVLFLVGLAALTVGVTLSWMPHLIVPDQFKLFLFGIVFWALLLWRPLQRYKYHNSETFHNLKGRPVVLIGATLAPGTKGQGKWSGTCVDIMLAEDVQATVHQDQSLIIDHVEGTVFIVRPVVSKQQQGTA